MSVEEIIAGQDLDHLVATKVMGWAYGDEERVWFDVSGNFVYCAPNSFIGLTPFSPSTRIDHAWMVVDKMNKDVRFRLTNLFYSQEEGRGYFANFGDWPMNTCGETAPLAICRAALMSLGVVK